MGFLLGAKRSDHQALFEWVDELESALLAPGVEREITDGERVEHRFRWSNGAPGSGLQRPLRQLLASARRKRLPLAA